ncbi:SDR family NAD(P)-dependent oxidoreductase [Streptomyces sp. NPDC001984]
MLDTTNPSRLSRTTRRQRNPPTRPRRSAWPPGRDSCDPPWDCSARAAQLTERALTGIASRDHREIATARRPETLADLPVDQRLRLDVTDQASVDQAIQDAGDIDVLVSNAGETVRAPLESVPLAEVERLFQLNTLGALRVAQSVLPAMRARGAGRLIFISSIQGRMVLPMIGPYGASKWALEALAETLAIETGHFGVTVSVVQPGAVSSGGGERAKVFLKENDPYMPLYEQLGALRGESVTPESVATAVADTIEQPEPPLRVPVGASAIRAVRARKEAPEAKPFLMTEIDW